MRCVEGNRRSRFWRSTATLEPRGAVMAEADLRNRCGSRSTSLERVVARPKCAILTPCPGGCKRCHGLIGNTNAVARSMAPADWAQKPLPIRQPPSFHYAAIACLDRIPSTAK